MDAKAQNPTVSLPQKRMRRAGARGHSVLIGPILIVLALLLLLPLAVHAQSDSTPPTMTFDPANGQTITNDNTILTVTFSEAVYSDASQTEFTYAQIGKLVTLKRDDINGDDLAFSSSSQGLRNDNTVLRVYPTHTNDLPGQVYFAIGERVSFYDAAGNEGDAANITFTVIQTPPATKSVIVSPSAPVILDGDNEAGAFLGVKLGKQPTGKVTVTISANRGANASGANCANTNKICIDSDGVSETRSNKPLTFTTSDWEYFQYVTVSAYSDTDSRNERITLTFDPSGADYGSVAAGTAKITVRDQNEKSVAPSTSALALDESSNGTFTARLTKQPTGTVTVAITSSNPDVTVSPTSLSFTASTWNTKQTVTVTSAADVNINDEEVYLTLDPSGADYASARTSTVVVNVKDNGTSGVIVSETSLSLNESGSGNTDTFTVKLSENPPEDEDVTVAIGVRAADWKPVQGGKRIATVVGSNTLTFTSENGTTAQTVTITGVADNDGNDETGTVHVTATGGDFTGLSHEIPLAVKDTSNNLAIQITRNGKTLNHITSGPATVTAGVRLPFQPSGNVTVTASSGHSLVSVSPSSFSFNAQNWDAEQALTLTVGSVSASDGVTVTLAATGYTSKTFKVFGTTPPTATIGNPGPMTVTTVTFSKSVGTCSTKTQTSAAESVCSGTVTAFTNSNIASVFEVVVASADHNNYETGDAITFTATIAAGDNGTYVATITPMVPAAGDDGEILSINLLVKDRYWSVNGGVIGATVLKTLTVQGPSGSNSPPLPDSLSNDDDPPVPLQPVVVQIPPPALSVGDATVTEGAGAQLAFTVSLDRAVLASDGTVSVAYATRDVTATAGADYTATSGTLRFDRDEQTKTVNVTVLEDEYNDGGETLELILSNPTGATITDGTGTGTIKNAATMPRAWSARFGRTIGTHITDAVSARLRDTGDAESHLTVAGWRVPLGSREKQASGTRQASASATTNGQTGTLLTGLAGILGLNSPTGGAQGIAPGGSPNGTFGGVPNGTPWLNGSPQPQNPGQALNLPDLRQALIGSAFRLNLNQNAGGSVPRLTAWGRVAHTQFDGQEGRLSLNGEVTTGTVGLDTQGDRWLAGIALAHSRGDGGYTIPDQSSPGDLDTTLTSLHPYLRYALTDRLTVWGLMGYGWGDLTLTQTDGTAIDADTDLLMGAVGSRGLLLDPATTGGLQVATRLDAMFTRTSTEAVAGLAATDADAHRLRLVLEGSQRIGLAEGRHLTPTVEVGVRHDWGDAETGLGIEVGGRVQYADPGLGLTVEGAVRALVAHEAEAYDEWGASGTVRLAPGVGGQGLALTLQPAWGATASGVEALWGRQSTAGLAPRANQAATGRLAAEVGYGMALYDTGLVTPYAGTILAEGAGRTYRVGTRLQLPGFGTSGTAMGLTMTLEGLRTEPTGLQPLNQGLRLQATWGF